MPLSANKLGFGYLAPIAPMTPTGAQVQLQTGYLHLQFGTAYISLTLRGTLPVSRMKDAIVAMKECASEPSYSGSGAAYQRLEVKAVDGKDDRCELWAGEMKLCTVYVDPAMELTSGDELIGQQIN